jgi:hypothetical protein
MKKVQILLFAAILLLSIQVIAENIISSSVVTSKTNNVAEIAKNGVNRLHYSTMMDGNGQMKFRTFQKNVVDKDTVTSFRANNPYNIEVKDAANHIGKLVCLKGKVYGHNNKANFIAIYLGAVYPNQLLTINLKGKLRDLANDIDGKFISVAGNVVLENNKPVIEVSNTGQITVIRR